MSQPYAPQPESPFTLQRSLPVQRTSRVLLPGFVIGFLGTVSFLVAALSYHHHPVRALIATAVGALTIWRLRRRASIPGVIFGIVSVFVVITALMGLLIVLIARSNAPFG